jgi:glycosyltransferase involved in cell wall biosynthesis
VIVPALNEALSIRQVVLDIRREYPLANVLVVDDGSVDDTAQLAKEAGALVLSLPYNLGIGGAMQAGYVFACEEGYDVAVQVDGDGQHDPMYLPVLLVPLEDDRADLVVGSRFIGPSHFQSSLARRAGIKWFSLLISLMIGQKLTDTTSGFRAVNRSVMEFFARTYPQDYPEPEAIVVVRRAGFRVQEVPVEMHQRQDGTSSITFWRSGYYVIKVTLAILMSFFRSIPPQERVI